MKVQSPWMGRIKGSAGNMTGCKVYDKNVIRAKAFEVSNPNTAAQQTERSFFAQVAECCFSVSEAALRSLFGVKPKSMSRRNALTKQLSAAFTIEGTNKVLDLSKLSAIGNGMKVKTPLIIMEGGLPTGDEGVSIQDFGENANENTNVIYIILDSKRNVINIEVSNTKISNLSESSLNGFSGDYPDEGVIYATCAEDGSNVYLKGIGSFTIKTRATN